MSEAQKGLRFNLFDVAAGRDDVPDGRRRKSGADSKPNRTTRQVQLRSDLRVGEVIRFKYGRR